MTALRRIRAAGAAVPAGVRRLGWISFWNDVAGEMVYPLVPLLLTGAMGAPVAVVGIVEGAGNALAQIVRGPAGVASDRRGRRPFVIVGYVMSSLAKPAIALAPAWPAVLALRAVDRTGKGVRSTPRDALISDLTEPRNRGAAFGFHRMLDSTGAVVGPLGAIALLAAGVSLRWAIAAAILPALVSLVLVQRIEEPQAHHAVTRPERAPLRTVLHGPLAWLTAALVLFGLANVADAFLLLRGSDLGLSPALVTLSYATIMAAFAASAWPAGALADRVPRRRLLVAGVLVFALAYAGLALADAGWQVFPLLALYGLSLGLTDGVGKALVSELAPAGRVGSALGLVAMLAGIAALVASLGAGLLWDLAGPEVVFALGAACAVGAVLLLLLAPRERAVAA